MLTLYSYPDLFGVADNNPFGLKVFAFLRLCHLPFKHRHILDTAPAPRGQLPYIVDGADVIGDSDAIMAHIKSKYPPSIDNGLSPGQLNLDLLVRRTLDDLYWPMSYSRWRDDRFWPVFRDALLTTHPQIAPAELDAAREYNRQRYYYQGIDRYEPEQVYARGIGDLGVIADLLGDSGFVFGPQPVSLDAGIYGFVANIYFYRIDTPLKQYVLSRPNLVRHCLAMHDAVKDRAQKSAV
jgi:glutathione S-transferase